MKLDKKDSEPVPEACTTQKNETTGVSGLPRYPEVSDQKSEEKRWKHILGWSFRPRKRQKQLKLKQP
jgi:hypothetical protein